MQSYRVDINATQRQIIGELNYLKISSLVDFTVESESKFVYLYPGVIRHVKSHHPGIAEIYGPKLPDILISPDYVGKNNRHPGSIELYKLFDQTILMSVKLADDGYLFVSSFYDLDNPLDKISSRLRSGRIVPYNYPNT